MVIGRTLASIVLGSAIVLSGCEYQISQEAVDQVVEVPVVGWVETSDNYMNIHQLLREGSCDEAQIALEQYLADGIEANIEYKGFIDGTDKVSENAAERIGGKIDGQIDKIQTYLEE